MSDKKEKEEQTEVIDSKDRATWDKVVGDTIEHQCDAFLRAFTGEYKGNFEEILDQAELFKKYSKNNIDHDEHVAHQFLEKHEEAITVKKLRDNLKLYDLDKNNRLCFLEFLLQKKRKKLRPNSFTVLLIPLKVDQKLLIKRSPLIVRHWRRRQREKKL